MPFGTCIFSENRKVANENTVFAGMGTELTGRSLSLIHQLGPVKYEDVWELAEGFYVCSIGNLNVCAVHGMKREMTSR